MAALDDAQAELLISLCEAARRQTKTSKESFVAVRTWGGAVIRHPLLNNGSIDQFHWPDLETLYGYGLVQGNLGQHDLRFDVSPAGLEHFEKLMEARGQPTVRLQETVRRLLDSTWFDSAFPDAMNLWRKAEVLYWEDRSGEHATAIGHHCREAMQLFGVSFANTVGLTPSPADKTSTTCVPLSTCFVADSRRLGSNCWMPCSSTGAPPSRWFSDKSTVE